MSTPALNEIEEHIPRLRRYARYLLGNPEAADDLVQDTLLRAVDKIHLWQPGSNMRAWLFSIMHNMHVTNCRKNARRPTHLVGTSDVTDIPDRSNQFERVQVNEMAEALEQLSDDHREVLLLIVIEGLAYEEAAEILDIAIGTVRSRLSRARDSLRHQLSVSRRRVTPGTPEAEEVAVQAARRPSRQTRREAAALLSAHG
jgi:RNA polymerase sigma-70 factor (ECF subfamily)